MDPVLGFRGRVPQRWRKPIAAGLSGLGLALFAFFLLTILTVAPYNTVVGLDRGIYHDAALRWLAGGFWFYPEQLAGPYEIIQGHILYPPAALPWLVPGAFLPDLLWWGIPLAGTAAIVVWHRPAAWSWPLMAGCLAYWWSAEIIASGNPTIWIMLFAALGTRWRPAFALVLLKPSLFPFAFLGVRSRGWWLAVAAIAAVSLALLPMWLDYLRVLVNARGPLASIWYSARDVPLVAIPLLAWLASPGRKGLHPLDPQPGVPQPVPPGSGQL
jgi:hypothetical protein